MFVRLTETSNRALLYDLYPYVWDVKEVLQLLDTFVNWLSTKNKRKKQKGQSFYPEDPEPWVFRGGLCGELQVCCTDHAYTVVFLVYNFKFIISLKMLHCTLCFKLVQVSSKIKIILWTLLQVCTTLVNVFMKNRQIWTIVKCSQCYLYVLCVLCLQRLLPIDGGHEVFNVRAPEIPTTCIYTIRPYQTEDEVYMISLNLKYMWEYFCLRAVLCFDSIANQSLYTLYCSLPKIWL